MSRKSRAGCSVSGDAVDDTNRRLKPRPPVARAWAVSSGWTRAHDHRSKPGLADRTTIQAVGRKPSGITGAPTRRLAPLR